MQKTKSTILYSDAESKDWFRDILDVVIANGGYFSMTTYFANNWFIDYEITWPENLDPTVVLNKE